jgi:signal transduction histidine kinase
VEKPFENDPELQRRLETAERAEGTVLLAYIMAHDVNNVLTAMLLSATTLAESEAPRVAEEAAVLLDGCNQIAAMVRRFQGTQRGRAHPLHVNSVLASLLPILRSAAGRGVQLTTRLEAPLPTVFMDPLDLERSALNLVTNARDAMPDGGAITLSTSLVHDGEDVPEGMTKRDWVVFEVADGGTGMDDATRARACEPFFTTKPEGRGTGLGLSSVATAARVAGGHVRIESAVGGGTRAKVWLPAH